MFLASCIKENFTYIDMLSCNMLKIVFNVFSPKCNRDFIKQDEEPFEMADSTRFRQIANQY